ncbi:hypothetical protein NAT51_04605 [Flavobacterium amniphilum]|uniref:hypothetical protein n=1 Tax=Flavobacterium amniphilum TaxID=1834035 RepID=UPI00202AA6B2|nr:hypothetical protein [Flavobacterium amniphilum]MCL9804788.1 hypothetical protein [Flavobacterium amniphilum]
METKTAYIEFEVGDEEKFNDMKRVYEVIAEAKNTGKPRPDEFWPDVFPDYALNCFYIRSKRFADRNEITERNDLIWHFEGIINHLQEDMDVKYLECSKTGNKGRIRFLTGSSNYGGFTGLVMFLNSFDCKTLKVDEGTELYKVYWETQKKFSFSCIDRTFENLPRIAQKKHLEKSGKEERSFRQKNESNGIKLKLHTFVDNLFHIKSFMQMGN